jgi:hypothetical protein
MIPEMVDGDFSVLVFDMTRTGEPDGERIVSGFASVEAARAYAEARVRCSVEELRKRNQSAAELRSLWHIYGEDCSVLGDSWKGREQLDLYIAVPATPAEYNWVALTPRPKRFHATLLVSDAAGNSVWAGGYLKRFSRPSRDELLEIYRQDAVDAFARKGLHDSEPVSVHIANLFELPDPPRPPAGRALRNWQVSVDFVCHDIKFGSSNRGVFAWPEQPAGKVLDAMIRVLLADACALRGDGPDWADACEVIASKVEPTTDVADYAAD